MNWQLNNIKYPVHNLGYGKRIGIWVQGCDLGCSGCINKTLWSKSNGKPVNVIDIANLVIELSSDFDGVTISGGEPFQQYEQLLTFIQLIKNNTNLDIYCFTGYELDELNQLYPDKAYSILVDRLMTGRYIKSLHSNDNLKGSTNQRLFEFNNGIPKEINQIEENTKIGLYIGKDNQIQMTAIPKENEIKIIEKELQKVNIHKKFI